MSDFWSTTLTIIGLGGVTLVTRVFFLVPKRAVPLPGWLRRGLKVAPLAAFAAVLVPEIILTQGQLISTWQDARWPAVAAATLVYVLRPGVFAPLVAGLLVFLPLRVGLGW